MAAKLQGRVTNVSDDDLGSSLDGDHAIGATTLKVQNVADFDEDGGTLVINDQQIVYVSCDDDTDTITLAEGLAAAADGGDTVSVWDTLRQVIAVDKVASVDVGDDYSDDIEAVVALHLVEHLVEGPRGDDGESVVLELDEEDAEWKVVEILGLGGPGSSGVKFEANDVYVLTAADVTAGSATIPLSHRPIEESVVAFWGVLPQEPTEYTVNYDAETVTWPLDGFEEVGDRLWLHYAYLVAGAAPPIAYLPFGSGGWRYLQVATTDATDRSGVAYDDSGFATGITPLSNSTAGHPFGWPQPVTAAWALNTDLWLRRTLTAPPGQPVIVSVRVDNFVLGCFWNGVLIGDSGGVASNDVVNFTVPGTEVLASNVLALRLGDDAQQQTGDRTYADASIEGAS